MYNMVGIMKGLLLLWLACAPALADEPPAKQDRASGANSDGVKAPDKTKAKAPVGYEDAPKAGDPPPAREAAAGEFHIEGAMEAEDPKLVVADLEQMLAIDVDANVANFEKQFLPQFKPLLTAELSFINRACDLKMDQRKKIKAASDLCLKWAVRKYATAQHGMRQGLLRAQESVPDPTDLLHQAFFHALCETLVPEQRAAYEEEMSKRKAHYKHVAIENIVAIIDERLVLAIDQRNKLIETLDKHWQPSWVQSIELLMNDNQYLPNIPDQFVAPVLNDTQREVWRVTQKQNYIVWGGVAWDQAAGFVDDFPVDDADSAASAN